jgi:hypothetical protein
VALACAIGLLHLIVACSTSVIASDTATEGEVESGPEQCIGDAGQTPCEPDGCGSASFCLVDEQLPEGGTTWVSTPRCADLDGCAPDDCTCLDRLHVAFYCVCSGGTPIVYVSTY